MTKLNKPITIVLENVNDAVSLCHRLNLANDVFKTVYPAPHYVSHDHDTWMSVVKQLNLRGIDWATWKPFTIGEYEVAIHPNGDAQVGCTRVDRETIKAVMKLSDEAVSKEPEWPKYWITRDEECVLEAYSESDFGTFYDADKQWKPRRGFEKIAALVHATRHSLKPIPAAEAKSILKK